MAPSPCMQDSVAVSGTRRVYWCWPAGSGYRVGRVILTVTAAALLCSTAVCAQGDEGWQRGVALYELEDEHGLVNVSRRGEVAAETRRAGAQCAAAEYGRGSPSFPGRAGDYHWWLQAVFVVVVSGQGVWMAVRLYQAAVGKNHRGAGAWKQQASQTDSQSQPMVCEECGSRLGGWNGGVSAELEGRRDAMDSEGAEGGADELKAGEGPNDGRPARMGASTQCEGMGDGRVQCDSGSSSSSVSVSESRTSASPRLRRKRAGLRRRVRSAASSGSGPVVLDRTPLPASPRWPLQQRRQAQAAGSCREIVESGAAPFHGAELAVDSHHPSTSAQAMVNGMLTARAASSPQAYAEQLCRLCFDAAVEIDCLPCSSERVHLKLKVMKLSTKLWKLDADAALERAQLAERVREVCSDALLLGTLVMASAMVLCTLVVGFAPHFECTWAPQPRTSIPLGVRVVLTPRMSAITSYLSCLAEPMVKATAAFGMLMFTGSLASRTKVLSMDGGPSRLRVSATFILMLLCLLPGAFAIHLLHGNIIIWLLASTVWCILHSLAPWLVEVCGCFAQSQAVDDADPRRPQQHRSAAIAPPFRLARDCAVPLVYFVQGVLLPLCATFGSLPGPRLVLWQWALDALQQAWS